jgi:S-adenosylmethionine decarboxylase
VSRVEQFGVHIMFDGHSADRALLADGPYLRGLLETLPSEMGMHVICEPRLVEAGPMNPKDPGGLSGVVMIAESHIPFHTFPKRGFVTMDLYTCQCGLARDWAAQRLKSAFGLVDADVFIQERGMRYPADSAAGADSASPLAA